MHLRVILLLLALFPGGVLAHGGPAPSVSVVRDAPGAPIMSASLRGAWDVEAGATAIRFFPEVLEALGIELRGVELTAATRHEAYLGFGLAAPARLEFAHAGGGFESLLQAELTHTGGFTVSAGGREFDAHAFRLLHAGNGVIELATRNGEVLFELHNAHIGRDANNDRLSMLAIDLVLSRTLAEWAGRAEHAGMLVGTVDITARVAPLGGDASFVEGALCVPEFGGEIDIALTAIGTLFQRDREPGVRVALAPSATLRNVGTADVPWYWAIDGTNIPPTNPVIGVHPYLAMHVYRIADGRIEQIGRSDLKHAWNTINSGCGCQGGQVLFVECEDVYGSANNANQFFFGPRAELSADSGAWTSLGSHFDGEPVDDFRDHADGIEHDGFEHRLVVAEPELDVSDARYLIEAWYIVPGDIDLFNSIAHREFVPELSNGIWRFPFSDTGTAEGPAIGAWVAGDTQTADARSTLVQTEGGALVFAVRVTDAGNGTSRYDYALMNLDLDRQVTVVTIPIAEGAQPTAVYATGGWDVELGSTLLDLKAPAGVALDWGSLVGFGFVSATPPTTTVAAVATSEPGLPGTLSALTLAPLAPPAPLDTDGDGVLDVADNCTTVANPDQRDTDGDRYGNVCDADLNGDGGVNLADLGLFKPEFLRRGDRNADLNGDGIVNLGDLGLFKAAFLAPPGPSGTR